MDSFMVVFPGQGSQYVGMLSALGEAYGVVKETFDEASSILGYDAWAMIQDGPDERLNDTRVTQPMLLAAGIAVWRVFNSLFNVKPTVMAGHSLGEYSALVAAGAFSFETGLRLVDIRARAMQKAVPVGVGAMAAVIGLDDDVVVDWCLNHSTHERHVSAVNFNAPGQVVIAGHKEAVESAMAPLKALGAKRVIVLPVSVPSHCVLMSSAVNKMAEVFEKTEFKVPTLPVIHNLDCDVHSDALAIKYVLLHQLAKPVRWVETMQAAKGQDIKAMFEMGPGRVLSGLQKRIDKSVTTFALETPEGMEAVGKWLEGSR